MTDSTYFVKSTPLRAFTGHFADKEIIETHAFYPEHIDIGNHKSAWIIIDLL